MVKYDMIELTLPDGEVMLLPSVIDKSGVRRYVRNAVLDEAFNTNLFDLNSIAAMCFQKNIPIKDRVIFWSMLGYSVDGMCDLANILDMDNIKVVTPEWTKDVYSEDDES